MSLLASIRRWWWKCQRVKYVALTYRDYAARLNRSVEVEQRLLDGARKGGLALTREECALLAAKLGVPVEFREGRGMNGKGINQQPKRTQ